MISHKHKCIFIHIPRTAGTSIENWLCGDDYMNIDGKNKHLIASQSKKKYKDYWDDYFKFSFVRNPFDRMVSCLLFPSYFKVTVDDSAHLNFKNYKKQWGHPIIIENDFRFSKRKDIISKKHKENQVYGNIIDEDLDFVGSFENLQSDILSIKKELGIKTDFNFHEARSNTKKKYESFYNYSNKKEVEDMFLNDLSKYNY